MGPRQITKPASAGNILRNFGITASRRLLSEVALADTNLSGTAALGNTYNSIIALGGHFDAIQIVFNNPHSAGYNVTLGLWAPTKSDNEDASNYPAALIGTQTVAVAAGAGYANTVDAVFTNTASTWIPINSLARTDGGTLPLIGVRTYIDSNGGAGVTQARHNGATADLALFNTSSNGRVWYNHISYGRDGVTTPGGMTAANSADAGCALTPFTVRARMRGGAITVLSIGDSTISGINNTETGRWNNFSFKACDSVSRTTLPVMAVNQGISGQHQPNFLTNGETMISSISPDIALFMSTTVNVYGAEPSAMTAAKLTATLGRVYEFIEYCRTRGIVPIITTMWPPTTPAVNADAAQFNASIRAMTNINILDIDYICGEPTSAANNRTWKTGYARADNTHPSAVGEAAVYPELARIIQNIITANGL